MKLSLATLRRLQAERIAHAFELEELGRHAEAALVWSIAETITARIEERLARQNACVRSRP